MKKWFYKKMQDLFWNWDYLGSIIRQANQGGRRDMIYWIVSRIEIDETIKFLKEEKEQGKKYWNLAGFIDKKLKD